MIPPPPLPATTWLLRCPCTSRLLRWRIDVLECLGCGALHPDASSLERCGEARWDRRGAVRAKVGT